MALAPLRRCGQPGDPPYSSRAKLREYQWGESPLRAGYERAGRLPHNSKHTALGFVRAAQGERTALRTSYRSVRAATAGGRHGKGGGMQGTPQGGAMGATQ